MTMADLTKEAAEGFDRQRDHHSGRPPAVLSCPYPSMSPAAMAWHLGRHLAAGGYSRPDLGRNGIHVLETPIGNVLRVVLFEDGVSVKGTATLFRWRNGAFIELP